MGELRPEEAITGILKIALIFLALLGSRVGAANSFRPAGAPEQHCAGLVADHQVHGPHGRKYRTLATKILSKSAKIILYAKMILGLRSLRPW